MVLIHPSDRSATAFRIDHLVPIALESGEDTAIHPEQGTNVRTKEKMIKPVGAPNSRLAAH